MLKINALRILIGFFIGYHGLALSARADETACCAGCTCAKPSPANSAETAATETAAGDSIAPDSTASATSLAAAPALQVSGGYSRFGARYVEAYASLNKPNHDVPTSINYGVEYNQPVARHLDVKMSYAYSYFQDYRFAYANFLEIEAFYHRTYGKFKPFAGVALGDSRQWADFDYSYWGTLVGVEYIPVEKLVIGASVGISDTFTAGDNFHASANASAIYWLFPVAGPYFRVNLAEEGYVNQIVGFAARYRF